METVVLVRYAEIHLKGLNRPYFERSLVTNITHALRPLKVQPVREQGRIFIGGIPEEEAGTVQKKLQKVFGIHSFSMALAVEKSFDTVAEAACILMERELTDGASRSFKVFSRRSDKRFPMRSEEICKELGGVLLDRFPSLHVDVHQPEIRVGVEIRQERAYVYVGELPGPGGMPVGCNGQATLLISGGIDSPVAGHMIAKRGVSLNAVHFYSYPYTSERARDKVVDLIRLVSAYAGPIDLYLVPFTDIQLTIYDKCPSTETTVLMRRQMMKIAERFARETGSLALITGESIGQVASQTMESLAVTDDAVTLPVYRPLIGFDKEEIVDRAKAIGTFETSIQPFEDCCTVFVPKHPVTRPKVEKLRESEAAVDFTAMVEEAVRNTEVLHVRAEG